MLCGQRQKINWYNSLNDFSTRQATGRAETQPVPGAEFTLFRTENTGLCILNNVLVHSGGISTPECFKSHNIYYEAVIFSLCDGERPFKSSLTMCLAIGKPNVHSVQNAIHSIPDKKNTAEREADLENQDSGYTLQHTHECTHTFSDLITRTTNNGKNYY